MIGYERKLFERQAQLRSRAAGEREQVAHSLESLQPYIKLTDGALRLGRAVASHKKWVAVGAAALAVFKPRKAARAASRLWFAWRTIRSARRYLRVLVPRRR